MAEKRKNDEATPKKKKEARCNQLSPREKEKLFNQYIMPRLDSIKSLTRRYTDHYQYVDDNYNYCLSQLYHYIGSYNPSQSIETWVHICTKRACFHQNKKRAEESSHWTDVEMCTQDDLHQHGTSMMFDAGFGSLADNVSDKVYNALMQIQGHGIREITSIEYKMGHLERRSEDMVKSRIFWAQKELQYILRQYGITGKNHKGKGND